MPGKAGVTKVPVSGGSRRGAAQDTPKAARRHYKGAYETGFVANFATSLSSRSTVTSRLETGMNSRTEWQL